MKEIKQLYSKLSKKEANTTPKVRTEASEDGIASAVVNPISASKVMRVIKKDLEALYKELMKILFGAEDSQTIPRDQAMPLENKINQLIEKINDSVDELESSSSNSFTMKDQ